MFVPYETKYELACIEILKSNLGKYFAKEEVADFILFLQNNTSNNQYFVGLLNDEIVSCGGWEEQANGCYLRWGMVSREKHKEGLGSSLLKFRLAQIAEQHGSVDIYINTSGQAHKFYEHFKFETISTQKDGIAKGIDQYVMKRVVNAL